MQPTHQNAPGSILGLGAFFLR